MRRFYAPLKDFSEQTVVLGTDETRHLKEVLRLRPGDDVQVFDGSGREFLCVIETVDKKSARLKVIKESVPAAAESPLDLTLAVAVTKGEKFDLVVQKAVELGVSKLIPLFTKRCDVKPGGSEKRIERWRKIALEACKQSGRAKLMTTDHPIEYSKFLDQLETKDTGILFSERGGAHFETIVSARSITVFVGPEGGWDDAELDQAKKRGIQIITLGGRILRAETAAIVCAALLQHRFGDLV
jgi:16S rRNA (uracil1498-N3)-methyltransferase